MGEVISQKYTSKIEKHRIYVYCFETTSPIKRRVLRGNLGRFPITSLLHIGLHYWVHIHVLFMNYSYQVRVVQPGEFSIGPHADVAYGIVMAHNVTVLPHT